MRIIRTDYLVKKSPFADSSEWHDILAQIEQSIFAITWPESSDKFTINPTKQGNGVVPIKNACMAKLSELGWSIAERGNLYRLDAMKELSCGKKFGFEWETGNISSSHRAINRIMLGEFEGKLLGGVLVVPSRKLYKFLTDRVGNYDELIPYIELWKATAKWTDGVFAIITIEQDDEDTSVPCIKKGTDGRALV